MTNSIKTKLLLIDQAKTVGKILRSYLRNENFDIIEADSGEMGLRMFLSQHPEVVVTDINLPDIDGVEIIRNIREVSEVPLIVCSQISDDDKIISSIKIGADDYVAQPFNPDLLIAKINSVLRRAIVHARDTINEFLTNGEIKINLLKHQITIADQAVFFSPKQYNLIKFLMINKGKVLTHREILKEIWGKGYMGESQYLRVHIGNIREKIRPLLDGVELIHTEPGIGYRMEIL